MLGRHVIERLPALREEVTRIFNQLERRRRLREVLIDFRGLGGTTRLQGETRREAQDHLIGSIENVATALQAVLPT